MGERGEVGWAEPEPDAAEDEYEELDQDESGPLCGIVIRGGRPCVEGSPRSGGWLEDARGEDDAGE